MNVTFRRIFLLFVLLQATAISSAQTSEANIGDSLAFVEVATLDTTKFDYDSFTILPGSGLFVRESENGEFLALDSMRCAEFKHLKFLDDIWFDQVVTSVNHIYVRNDKQVYDIGQDACSLVAEFDTASFRLFAATDTTFLFVVYQDEGSLLYQYRLSTDDVELLYATADDIYGAEQLNGSVWFVAGNTLYEINGEGVESIFTYDPESFIGMTLTRSGALVYSTTKVILFDGADAYPVASGSFFRLLNDADRTYFILRDGEVLATDVL